MGRRSYSWAHIYVRAVLGATTLIFWVYVTEPSGFVPQALASLRESSKGFKQRFLSCSPWKCEGLSRDIASSVVALGSRC